MQHPSGDTNDALRISLAPTKMIEPRVASVALSIDLKGFATVTVTHAIDGTARERTVVYTGNDLTVANETVDTWTAKMVAPSARSDPAGR